MVAAEEQMLGPTDVSLSNWTVRPSSGCSVVLATHTGVSVDGYPDPGGEPVEHRAWSTAKMYFTVPPNGVAKLHFGAHFQAPGLPNQSAGTVDVYGLQILDATLETGNTVEAEEDRAALALLLKHKFLDGGADDVTQATLGEVLLKPTLATLGNFLVGRPRSCHYVGVTGTFLGTALQGVWSAADAQRAA